MWDKVHTNVYDWYRDYFKNKQDLAYYMDDLLHVNYHDTTIHVFEGTVDMQTYDISTNIYLSRYLDKVTNGWYQCELPITLPCDIAEVKISERHSKVTAGILINLPFMFGMGRVWDVLLMHASKSIAMALAINTPCGSRNIQFVSDAYVLSMGGGIIMSKWLIDSRNKLAELSNNKCKDQIELFTRRIEALQ